MVVLAIGASSIWLWNAPDQGAAPAPTPVSLTEAIATESPPSPATPSPQSTPTLNKVTTASALSEPSTTSSADLVTNIPTYTYTIVNTYPHDRNAFTQGLIYVDDIFYEGTGLVGRSTLRKVAVETGEVLQSLDLAPNYFGEGITVFGDKIIQLTWKARRGFEYDKDTFKLLREFTYPTEGWGIPHDGEKLIMSDGSANLYFWNPETFEEIGRVTVFDDNGPVTRLNELEYINGEVYANVWQTDRIARIGPATGQVIGWIDLTGLLTAADRSEPVDVLNGIAYDADTNRLFVTGKFWPKVFEIELVEQ